MDRLIYALAALPFLVVAAMAQPTLLDERQMDHVTAAGEDLASWRLNPSAVPGGTLVAKVNADGIVNGALDSFVAYVTSPMGAIGAAGQINRFDVHFFEQGNF